MIPRLIDLCRVPAFLSDIQYKESRPLETEVTVQQSGKVITPLRISSQRYGSVALVLLLLIGTVKSENGRAVDLIPSSAARHQWGSVTLFHGLPSDHVRA